MSFAELANVVTIRPLGTWPGRRTERPSTTPFDADWSSTVDLLAREVRHLRTGREKAVLQLDITEAQLRNDGLPYARAKIADRGVILSVPSDHGHLSYPCDTFVAGRWGESQESWQHNVRAIALALEALRKVDRYGVAGRGQQYAGWKQLPASGDTGGVDPLQVLLDAAGISGGAEAWRDTIDRHPERATRLYKTARAHTHPDRDGGSHDAFLAVQAAAEQLGVA